MAWFSASTSKCFVKWNVLLFTQKSVWMKDAWRNWWNLRFVGHFNIQVIIPSEMYCKWTVCLTFLSVCSSPSVSQLATSTNAKIRLFCWLPLPYFNGRPFRDLLQNAWIKLLPDQRCRLQGLSLDCARCNKDCMQWFQLQFKTEEDCQDALQQHICCSPEH